MWTRTHQKLYPKKLYPNLTKKRIWQLWTDINHWPKWHHDLEYCTLVGPFEAGNYFMLKPKGVPAVKIELTSINTEQSFSDCTKFFGARMVDTHAMEETTEGLLLTNTMIVTGPLRWLWIKLVAQGVANDIPAEMDALVELAEKAHE
ncbi:MAG: SRPBCC family protein [Pseudomonadota bacterium]